MLGGTLDHFGCDSLFKFGQRPDFMAANSAHDHCVALYAFGQIEAVFPAHGAVEFDAHTYPALSMEANCRFWKKEGPLSLGRRTGLLVPLRGACRDDLSDVAIGAVPG